MAAYLRPEFTRGTLTGGRRLGARQRRIGRARLLRAARHGAGRRAHVRGRWTSPSAPRPCHQPRFWRQRFGGDPRTIGQTIQVMGERRGRRRDAAGIRAAHGGRSALAAALVRTELAAGTQPRRGRADRPGPSRARRDDRIGARGDGHDRRTPARQYPATNASFGVTTDPLVDRVIGRRPSGRSGCFSARSDSSCSSRARTSRTSCSRA